MRAVQASAGIMMALFGLLWAMRIRAEVRKDKCRERATPRVSSNEKRRGVVAQDGGVVLPPPVSFANGGAVERDADADVAIPPPPPPPASARLAEIHRSASVRRARAAEAPLRTALRHPSRSAQNLTLECTCPRRSASASRRAACVRFCDDPFGFYSARGQSWNYPSVVSTLPRRHAAFAAASRRCHEAPRPLSASAQGTQGTRSNTRTRCNDGAVFNNVL